MTEDDAIAMWVSWNHRTAVGGKGGNKPVDFNAEVDRYEPRPQPVYHQEVAERVESIFQLRKKASEADGKALIAMFFGGKRGLLKRARLSRRQVDELRASFRAQVRRDVVLASEAEMVNAAMRKPKHGRTAGGYSRRQEIADVDGGVA